MPNPTSNAVLRWGALLIALALPAAPAAAQVQVRVTAALPAIRFEVAPPLVLVTEGVEVVPDHDQEVFYSRGWYWHCRDQVWYRMRDHRGGWAVVDRRYVPVALVGLPPGKYKHWRRGKPDKVKGKQHQGRGQGRGKGKHGNGGPGGGGP
jgi:hypothetical protein